MSTSLYGLHAHLAADGTALDVYRVAGCTGVRVALQDTADRVQETADPLYVDLDQDAARDFRDALTRALGDGPVPGRFEALRDYHHRTGAALARIAEAAGVRPAGNPTVDDLPALEAALLAKLEHAEYEAWPEPPDEKVTRLEDELAEARAAVTTQEAHDGQ